MLCASPPPKLPSGTSTVMEEPEGHPPSVGTASALRGCRKAPHSPASPPNKAQSTRVPLSWLPGPTPSPSTLAEVSQDLQPSYFKCCSKKSSFLSFFAPPPRFFIDTTNQTRSTLALGQRYVMTVSSHGQIKILGVLHNQVLGKRKISFFL